MFRRLVFGVVGLVGAAALMAVGCGSRDGFEDSGPGVFAEAGADTGSFSRDGVPARAPGRAARAISARRSTATATSS